MVYTRCFQPTRWLLCLLLFVPSAFADEPKSASDKKANEEKPETLKVSGVFEATQSQEVKAGTKHMASLEITRLAAHGAKVSKGQNVVWFDTEPMDKKVKEVETALRLSKLTLDDDEFGYKQFVETQKLDRAAADRAKKAAQQDYDNFVKVDRERQRLDAEFSIKSSTASLANAQEELKQLEQMYKEDDLTEESEEIVLKRAKQSVEAAQHRLAGTMIISKRTIDQSIPRSQASQDDKLARASMTYQKTLHDLNTAKQRRDIEIKQKRDAFADEEKKVTEIRAERKKAVLQSSLDGIVIYGSLARGKISDKPSTLKVGSKVTGDQVIATIVGTKQLQVRVDLKESESTRLVVGSKCKITAKAFPDHELSGQVKTIAKVPYAAGKFDCVVSLKGGKELPAILPTMNCDLEFVLPKKKADK